MALTGGCFSTNTKWQVELIRQKLESFSIIPSDRPQEYKTKIFEGKFGYLVTKFKKDAPVQVRYKTDDNHVVLTLGFHDLQYSQGTDEAFAKSKPAVLTGRDPSKQIEESEGEFVSLLMEHDSGDIHIIDDRFAVRPFFIFRSAEGVFFSSNLAFLLHLAGHRPTPDPLGILQVFGYGHTLETKTNLQDIERLRPASHIVVSKEGIQERQYWRLAHNVEQDLDAETFAEETFEAFQASTSARTQLIKRGFVALSGGLDSRLLAGAIPRDSDYYAFTFVDSTSSENTPEVNAAKEVSKILGLPHRLGKIPPTEVSDVADCLVMLTGGLMPIHHPVKTLQYIRQMRENNGFMIGGGPGDVLAGSYVSSVHYLDSKRKSELVRQYCSTRKKFSRNILSLLFRDDMLEQYFPKLDESMLACFQKLTGPTAAHQISAWAMTFRQPAFTFTSPIHNHPDVTEASPHLGYRYVDQMLKLPAEWIYNKNFYKFMIYHCLPELRDVVYANTGEKLPGCIQEYKIPLRKLITNAIEKRLPPFALRQLRKIQAKRTNPPRFEYSLLRGDQKLLSQLKEIIHSTPELREIFDMSGCDRFLDDFKAGRLHTNRQVDETELMGSLVSTCYWFKNIYGILMLAISVICSNLSA